MKWNSQGSLRKNHAQFPLVLVFDLGISKGCQKIFGEFQGCKLVFSGISWESDKYNFQNSLSSTPCLDFFWKSPVSGKTDATVSTSNFLIQPLVTTFHSFLYVQIYFRTFRIAITPTWNNYFNITNISITLYLSQMKQICGSHYFFCLFTNPANCALST